MDKYYISENNQVLGTYTLDELKNISFNTNTLAWKKGMTEWKKVREIEDLNLLLEQKKKSIPPPFNYDSELFSSESIYTNKVEIIHNNQNGRKFKIPFVNQRFSPIYLGVLVIIIILIGIGIHLITKLRADRIPLTDIEKHLFYQKEKGIESIPEYEILLKENPRSCEAYYLLAQLNFSISSGNIDIIKIGLLKSLQLKSDFFYSNALLAQIYYNEDNLAEAKNLAIKAQEENKDSTIKDLIDSIEMKEQALIEKERVLEEELSFDYQKKTLIGEYYAEESIYSQSGQGYIYLKAHLIVKQENGNFSCTLTHRGVLPSGELIVSDQIAYLDEIKTIDAQKLEGIIHYSDGHKGNFKWDGINRFLVSTLKTSLFPDNPEFLTYRKIEK